MLFWPGVASTRGLGCSMVDRGVFSASRLRMLAAIACANGLVLPPRLRAPLSGKPAQAHGLSRRQVLAFTVAGAAQLPLVSEAAAATDVDKTPSLDPIGFLSMQQQGSRLKRASLDAVQEFYSEDFCALLARWLICYDPPNTQLWAKYQAAARAFKTAPTTMGTRFAISNDAKREMFLRSKFENLVTSVEVGLEKCPGPSGAEYLAERLASRCKTNDSRLALAQLFSLLGDGQPKAQIRSLIGEVDNAQLLGVDKPKAPLGGYSKTAPVVDVSRPGWKKGRPAAVVANIRPTGNWLGVKVTDGGDGYEDGEQPLVYLARTPAVMLSAGSSIFGADPVQAHVTISRGRVVAIALPPQLAQAATMPPALAEARNEATGSAKGRLALAVAPPRRSRAGAPGARRSAAAELLAEYEVASLDVTEPGTGYLVDEAVNVSVRAPSGSAAAVSAVTRAAVQAVPRMSTRADETLGGAPRQLIARLQAQGELSLPMLEEKQRVAVELLPSAIRPRLEPSGSRYALPLAISPGIFGKSAALPVERKTKLSGSASASLFVAGGVCWSNNVHPALRHLASDYGAAQRAVHSVRTRLQDTRPAGLDVLKASMQCYMHGLYARPIAYTT